ncbi:MAG: hypothetical protein MUO35_11590 [Anaerolineales bacterium]|jgi:hypothetical protein|nr:hypothetical protein [Anaerolineales bacterium]
MNAGRSFDDRLADRVRSLGLGGGALVLLEAFAPLAWVGAQLGYLVEPLIGGRAARGSSLTGLLEDPERFTDFIERLHEEPPP